MDSGSMVITDKIEGAINLFIEGNRAHGSSENALKFAQDALVKAKSSRSPVESEINFLTEWIRKNTTNTTKDIVEDILFMIRKPDLFSVANKE